MENATRSFSARLVTAIAEKGSAVCVGLDPRRDQLPKGMLPASWADETDAIAQAYRAFCRGVIDVVAPIVPAVKPQMAFFEQLGPAGMRALKKTVEYARENGLLVILDGKRNDIGSTAKAYADAYLGGESAWGGDALTVNPYLGHDSLVPFVKAATERSSAIFTLVKTSNPGSGMLQDLVVDGRPMYEVVADQVEAFAKETVDASQYGAVGAVVGATYPEQLAKLRKQMPHAWLLVPGFGSQGGTAAHVAAAFDDQGSGALINSSRAIIFAHQRPEFEKFGHAWQDAVQAATIEMIDQLRR